MKKQKLGDVSNLVSLTVEGYISADDLAYIESLEQLQSLAILNKPRQVGYHEYGLCSQDDYRTWWDLSYLPKNVTEFAVAGCGRWTYFTVKPGMKLKKMVCDYYPNFINEQIFELDTLILTRTEHNREIYAQNISKTYPWSGHRGMDVNELENVCVVVGELIVPSYTDIPAKGEDTDMFFRYVLPVRISFRDSPIKILNHYYPSLFSLDKLTEITNLSPYAFAGSDITEITLPSNITQIPHYCFKGCKNLNTVTMEGVKVILDKAFENTPILELRLPATVEKLDINAFAESNIRVVYLDGEAPMWEDSDIYIEDAMMVQGTCLYVYKKEYEQSYQVGPWKGLYPLMHERISKWDYPSKKMGVFYDDARAIGNQSNDVVTLKLSGILDDYDIKSVYLLRNLITLDLSECVILKSEYTAYKEYLEEQAIRGIAKQKLQQMQNINQMEHDAGWRSSQSYYENKALMDAAMRELKQSDYKYEKPNKDCYLPKDVFYNNRHLNEVKLPQSLTYVSESFKNVRKVVLPQNLKRIEEGAFRGCDLSELIIPPTLEYIGPHCFDNKGMIEELDLSDTQIQSLPRTAFSSGIKVLKAPKGLKTITSGNPSASRSALASSSIVWNVETVYYYTVEPPEGVESNIGYNQTIHIPKGSKRAWLYKVSSQLDRKQSTLVDDL